jgi:CheY-like chemotaxis protein
LASRLSWIDRFLPAALRTASPEDRARARLVVLALLPFFLAAIPAATDYHLGGSPLAVNRLDSLRVLVVEDDVVNQLVVRGMLESLGCRVAVAEDGQECLERLSGEPFDAILMDCQMPRMDGLTATQAIRSSPRTTSLPVIGLTASLTPQDRESCLHAGMDEVLGKPCSIESLRESLARHTGLGANARQG